MLDIRQVAHRAIQTICIDRLMEERSLRIKLIRFSVNGEHFKTILWDMPDGSYPIAWGPLSPRFGQPIQATASIQNTTCSNAKCYKIHLKGGFVAGSVTF